MADDELTDPDGFPEKGYEVEIAQLAFDIWLMKVGLADSSPEQLEQWREALDDRCAGLARLRGLTG